MVEPDFRAISSGQLSLGIAEHSNYNFISRSETEKLLNFCTARTALGIRTRKLLKWEAANTSGEDVRLRPRVLAKLGHIDCAVCRKTKADA
jgi:hypothetical protein